MPEIIPDAPVLNRGRSRAITAVAFFVAILSLGGWWAGKELRPAPVSSARPAPGGARLFEQVFGMIASRYVDSIEVETIYSRAVNGLLGELHDPYTAYLPEDRLQKLDEQMSGVYTGIGLNIEPRDGWPTAIAPLPGGPAERAGVQAGDRFIEIAGKPTQGWTFDDASKALRGPPGSTVNVIVERGDQRIPIVLRRNAVHVRAVSRMLLLAGGVGYVDVKRFSAQTALELGAAIDTLVKQGARSLVLDLRGNPGGLLEQGVAVAELFLDPGQSIVELRARSGAKPEVFSDRDAQRWPTLPLAVLVDHGSASASEIVAGALQDHDRALVIGMQSYGKGSAQNVYPLTSGGALRLTTARWFTPVGRSISRVDPRAIEDDDDAPGPPPGAPDTVQPRFRTESGRTVLGGGGITPDVVINDSITPVPVQVLARTMGKNFGEYRDALAKLALSLKRSGAVRSPQEPVTGVMLDALYRDLVARSAAPDRRIFDNASPWIARALGYEMTRVAYDADAEFLRRASDDQALQRAMRTLTDAKTPREVFARLEQRETIGVPTGR